MTVSELPPIRSAHELLEEHSKHTPIELMSVLVDAIDSKTDELLEIAEGLTKSNPSASERISYGVDHIWDATLDIYHIAKEAIRQFDPEHGYTTFGELKAEKLWDELGKQHPTGDEFIKAACLKNGVSNA